MEAMMHGTDDIVVTGAGNLDSSSGMTESGYNYVIPPLFAANSNPAFVEDDEVTEEEKPSVCAILEGRSRGLHGVAADSSAQPRGLTDEAVIKYSKEDYEELPHPSGAQDGYMHIDDGSVVVGAGPFSRSSGGANIPDGKQHLVSWKKGIDGKARRRSNPLYDFPVNRPGVYPLSNQGSCGSSWSCCTLQTLVFLLAAAALVLAIISLVTGRQTLSVDRRNIDDLMGKYRNLESDCSALCHLAQIDLYGGNSSDFNSIVQELLRNNSEFQKIILDLQVKVQRLETAIDWQSGVNQNLSSQIDSQKKQINLLQTENMNTTDAVDFLRNDLSSQLSQISRGLVNLTSCGHRVESSGTSVRQTVTTTNSLNLNDSVVLSVVCSTDGGTQALLRSDRNSPSVYSCECSGQMNSSVVSRYCIIHYWTCPILP